MKNAFGYQLLIDLYGCRPGVCNDMSFCYDFLEKIVLFLKMEKQAPPSIFRSDEKKYPEKAGLSGWVPLIESSVVIHTLSKKSFISVDIYSCNFFDPKKTAEFISKYFKVNEYEFSFVERGKMYYSK